MRNSSVPTSIKNRLIKNGWFVIKLLPVSNDGQQLIAFKDSRSVLIEVEPKGNERTPVQEIRHQQLKNKGFEIVIAKTLKDTIHLCN